MKRAPRLCAYAAGMLAVAILACAALRDGEPEKRGLLEVSGDIVVDGARTSTDAGSAASSAVYPSSEHQTSAEDKAQPLGEPVQVKALSLARAAALRAEASALLDVKDSPVVEPGRKATEDAPKSAVSGPHPAPSPDVKPVAQTPAPKKVEPKRAQTRERTKQKDSAGRSASKAVPVRSTVSPVEAALADARAGRLAPSGDMTVETSTARYERVVTSAKYAMKGSLIKLVLRGNAPMVGNFYVLADPDRVVLDLAGNWEVDLPKVPSNRLIAAARVGQHQDKTRLVFDMKNTGRVALVPLNRNALELRIQ